MLSRPFSPDSASRSYPPQPKLYMLITVPLSIKYVSILAPLVAKFDLNSMKFLHYFEDRLAELGVLEYVDRFRFAGTSSSFSASAEEGGRVGNRGNPMPVFVAGIYDYLTALRAMREHWSQLVWFRWLNVLFSRYMWVNEWAEVSLRMEPVQGTADENAAV
jgi:N-acetylglucosaminylphosphatidylinositol deacetylase